MIEWSEELIRLGVTPTEIADGYELALEKCLEILPKLVCKEVKDNQDIENIKRAILTSVQSKQYGNEEFLSDLIIKACSSIIKGDTTFNVDNVRVCKIPGSGLFSSQVKLINTSQSVF